MVKQLAPFLSYHPDFHVPVAIVRAVDEFRRAAAAANAQFGLHVDMSRAIQQVAGEMSTVPVRIYE